VDNDWWILANSLIRRFMEFFLPFAFGDALCQLVKLLEPNSDSGTGLGKKLNQTEEEESIE